MKTTAILASLVLGLAISGQTLAGDSGAVVGGAVGGAIGAAIGQDINGRNGAIVGAAIGGATGAAIGSNQQKSTTVVQEKVVVQQPVEKVVYVRDDHDYRHDNGKHKGWYKHHHKHHHHDND